MIATIVWYAGAIIILLLLVLLILFITAILCLRYQLAKFMSNLPWFRWLTLEELPELGLSRKWGCVVLTLFHENGYLEIQLIDEDGMEEWEHEVVAEFGFIPSNVYLYEFRLIKRRDRKKKWIYSLRELFPGLIPARA